MNAYWEHWFLIIKSYYHSLVSGINLDNASLSTLSIILAIMLFSAGFFAMAETALMAINRYRLKQQAREGQRAARLTLALLAQTDKLLGVLLLGNNFINAASTSLTTVITIRLLGENGTAVAVGTAASALAIMIFSELLPKVLGASYPDKIGKNSSYILTPLFKLFYPIVWLLDTIVQSILHVLRLRNASAHDRHTLLSPEELRTFILDNGRYLPARHRSILLKLFALDQVTVEDVMIPRAHIESLNLNAEPGEFRAQLLTSHHTRLPVYRDDSDNIVGWLHIRHCLNQSESSLFSTNDLLPLIKEPYFVPCTTPLLTQIQNFQTNQQRLAFVVDEYGQLMGLVTLDDILEELVGQFTTSPTNPFDRFQRDKDGNVILEGSLSLRLINEHLNINLPTDGSKTLNGLLLDYLETFPEGDVACKIQGYVIEILHIQDRSIRLAKIYLDDKKTPPKK
jgi:Mg2+/Co2+ transporter CorB